MLPRSFFSSARTGRVLLLVVLPSALATLNAEPSRACSLAGSAVAHDIPGCGSSMCTNEIPRNAVFFDAVVSVDGVPTDSAPVGGETFFEPLALLPVGASVSAGSTTAVVGDFLDSTAPAMPDLLSARVRRLGSGGGCGASSSCDGVETFELDVALAADDMAGTSGLTLFVYLGNSAAEVAGRGSPSLRLVPFAVGPSSTFTAAPVSAIWVAVETMDQAGNRSERTAAVRIAR